VSVSAELTLPRAYECNEDNWKNTYKRENGRKQGEKEW
jgi:hypothetical protein